jgi:hypothetical protein
MAVSDRRGTLLGSYENAAVIVSGIDADELGHPTPCRRYDVAALIDHLVEAAISCRFRALEPVFRKPASANPRAAGIRSSALWKLGKPSAEDVAVKRPSRKSPPGVLAVQDGAGERIRTADRPLTSCRRVSAVLTCDDV